MSVNHSVDRAADLKAEDEHRRQVIGAKRRNNIYGETSDYVMMSFLAIGGEGGVYMPGVSYTDTSTYGAAVVSIFARGAGHLYAVRLTGGPLTNEACSQPWVTDLAVAASVIGAVPVVAIPNEHSRRAKFYGIDGSRIHYFD